MNKEITISDKLLKSAKSKIFLFTDQDGNKRAIVSKNGRCEIIYVPGQELQIWLRKLYHDSTCKTIAAEHISQVEATLHMMSHEPDVPTFYVYTRTAQLSSGLYYNLGNSQMVVIGNKGVVIKPVTMKKVCFQKSSPQAIPNLDMPASRLPNLLGDFIRVSNKSLLLLAVWLCSCFLQGISHPIMVVFGSQGSSKTTVLRTLNRIVDPVPNDVFTLPTDRKSLVAVLSNRYFMEFDNLQVLPQWVSDLMCNVVTGGSKPMRELYTTNNLKAVNLKGCVAVNGIDVVVTKRDLLDRSILLELRRIPDSEYMTEQEYFEKLDTLLPDIWGGIFNTLHAAMQLYKMVKLQEKTRMADFTKWGYCIAEAIGQGLGEQFLASYLHNRQKATQEYRPDDLIKCVTYLMEQQDTWRGKSQNLYDEMKSVASLLKLDRQLFPITTAVMTRRLMDLEPELLSLGISIKKYKDSKGVRGLRLSKKSNAPHGDNGGNGDINPVNFSGDNSTL